MPAARWLVHSEDTEDMDMDPVGARPLENHGGMRSVGVEEIRQMFSEAGVWWSVLQLPAASHANSICKTVVKF